MPASPPDESGFTIVEVLVATALLLAAMGTIGGFFISSWDSTHRIVGNSRSQVMNNSFVQRLTTDLEKSRSPNRFLDTMTLAQMKKLVLGNTDTACTLCEVPYISQQEIWIWTDVINNDPDILTECVGYFLTDGKMFRSVYTDATNCGPCQRTATCIGGGAIANTEYLFKNNAVFFNYRIALNREAQSNICTTHLMAEKVTACPEYNPDPAYCYRTIAAAGEFTTDFPKAVISGDGFGFNPSSSQFRNAITSIVVSANLSDDDISGSERGLTEITLPSHLSTEHQKTVGCV